MGSRSVAVESRRHPSLFSGQPTAPELMSKMYRFFFSADHRRRDYKIQLPSGSSWSKKRQQFQTPGRQPLRSQKPINPSLS